MSVQFGPGMLFLYLISGGMDASLEPRPTTPSLSSISHRDGESDGGVCSGECGGGRGQQRAQGRARRRRRYAFEHAFREDRRACMARG
eukprot:3805063-Rhodomonas_salina.1